MAARQNHGFTFQDEIENLWGIEEKSGYTDKWDMKTDKVLYSIKNIKISGAVELGSLKRFFEHDKPFLLIIGWHNVTNKNYECGKNCVLGVEEVEFTMDMINALRGNITYDEVVEATNKLTTTHFPAGKNGQKLAQEWYKNWRVERKDRMSGLLNFNGKVDHLDQRRWQCSINRANWVKLVGARSTNPIYRGIDFSTIDFWKK